MAFNLIFIGYGFFDMNLFIIIYHIYNQTLPLLTSWVSLVSLVLNHLPRGYTISQEVLPH